MEPRGADRGAGGGGARGPGPRGRRDGGRRGAGSGRACVRVRGRPAFSVTGATKKGRVREREGGAAAAAAAGGSSASRPLPPAPAPTRNDEEEQFGQEGECARRPPLPGPRPRGPGAAPGGFCVRTWVGGLDLAHFAPAPRTPSPGPGRCLRTRGCGPETMRNKIKRRSSRRGGDRGCGRGRGTWRPAGGHPPPRPGPGAPSSRTWSCLCGGSGRAAGRVGGEGELPRVKTFREVGSERWAP